MFFRYEVYTTVQSICCYQDGNMLKNKLIQNSTTPSRLLEQPGGGYITSIGCPYSFPQSSSESSSKE